MLQPFLYHRMTHHPPYKALPSYQNVLMKNRDGIYFWASISARVSPNGKWHDGIIEDISERKYSEETIMQIKLEEERYHAMMSHFLRNDLQK